MIEQELLGYQFGFIVLYIGFLFLLFLYAYDTILGNRLRKNKILETKKGTYTFIPKGEIQK